MMGDNDGSDRGVTYIGPRELVIGFALYCSGFLVFLFGANWISERSEAREPVVATVAAAIPLAVAAPPVVALPAQPALHPVQLPSRSQHAAVTVRSASASPPTITQPVAVKARAEHAPARSIAARPVAMPARVVPAAVAQRSVDRPRIKLVYTAGPVVRAASPPVVRATPSPTVRTAPSLVVRAAPPPVVRAAPQPIGRAAPPPIVRIAHAPAGLLVPFRSASGLTSSGELDPRTGAQASLVGPTSRLGPNPAAAPFGGTLSPQPH